MSKSEKYINGRSESYLKINNNNIRIGYNNVLLKIIDKDNKEFYKEYIYEKQSPPFGGICIASPNIGISLRTEINFKFLYWESNFKPLSYKLYSITGIDKIIIIDYHLAKRI